MAVMTQATAYAGEPDDFEWFNVWWTQTQEGAANAVAPALAVATRARSAGAALAAATRAALLARYIGEIEAVRDALYAGTSGKVLRVPFEGGTPRRRSTDAAPLVLGGIIGVFFLSVFTAAASVMKLAR
jgi:hypothetical protein